MTATTTGREVDAASLRILRGSYEELSRYGVDSVRAAWRFGQCLDSMSDRYTRLQIADALNLSVGTIRRYTKLHEAYQRPELAVDASKALETFNIDTIVELQSMLHPVEHARPYAGRRYRYRCTSCHVVGEVERVEVDPDTMLPLPVAVGA